MSQAKVKQKKFIKSFFHGAVMNYNNLPEIIKNVL